MDRLLSDLVEHSTHTSLQLLRSELPSTEVVREHIEGFAQRIPCDLVAFDLRSDAGDGVVQAVNTAMKSGCWVFVANVSPKHDQLLRKVALLAFTTDSATIHHDFRLWLSALTQHTSFEPPPIHSGVSLPRVLLHLCNAPQSLLGDMDTMRVVEKYAPDASRYDNDGFDSTMADTVELLFQNDPSVSKLCYEATKSRAHGAAFFIMLPDAFKYNTTLKDLDLTECCIGEDGSAKLGASLRFNKGITSINLSRNELRDECLAALCMGLAHNSTLQSLNLSHNTAVGNEGLRAIGAALQAETCGLKHLQLDYNNSLQVEAAWRRCAIRSLWEGVVQSRLSSLSMVGCELSGFSCASLADMLGGNTYLSVLNLSNNRLGDAGVVPFARLLKHGRNTALSQLYFDDCCLGNTSVAAFGAALCNNSSLETLSLNGSTPGKAKAFRSIKCDAEEEAEPTPELALETDELTDSEMKALSELEAAMEEEDLRWEKTVREAEEVARESGATPPPDPPRPKGPSKAAALRRVGSQYSNVLSDSNLLNGVQLLADGLAANHTLKNLRLGSSFLTDPLVGVLSTSLLEANDAVTSLDLSGNLAVGDAGSQSVQTLLRGGFGHTHTCTLRILDASETSELFGERVILSLDATPLEHLFLRNVGVTDGVALTLRDSLTRNPSPALSLLDLTGNSLHKEGFARLGEVLLNPDVPLRDLRLGRNLNTAHLDTFTALHDPGTRPDGLPLFKDEGLDEVRPFHQSLQKLRKGSSSLAHLDLTQNTLTDTCISDLLSSLADVDVEVTINLRGNKHTSAIIPLIDVFALNNAAVTIDIDEPTG